MKRIFSPRAVCFQILALLLAVLLVLISVTLAILFSRGEAFAENADKTVLILSVMSAVMLATIAAFFAYVGHRRHASAGE